MAAASVADLNVTLKADTTVGSVIVPQKSAQLRWADFQTSAPSGIGTSSDRYVSVYPSVSGKPGMMREDGRAMRMLPGGGRAEKDSGSGPRVKRPALLPRPILPVGDERRMKNAKHAMQN